MKACIYARVSSEKQVDKDLSIKAQVKELKKYAAANDHSIVNIFVDEAKSAKTANRPAFQEILQNQSFLPCSFLSLGDISVLACLHSCLIL